MAQGRKITKKEWDKFLKVYAEEATSVVHASRRVGIRDRSFYNKCADDPEFAEKAQRIRDGIRVPFAEDKLFVLMNNGDLGAIKFYLTHVGGRRWNTPKILPLIVREEINNSQSKKDEKFIQRVPNHQEMIIGKIAEDAMFIGIDDIPRTMTVDLSGIQARLKESSFRKRMLEENRKFYEDEDQ